MARFAGSCRTVARCRKRACASVLLFFSCFFNPSHPPLPSLVHPTFLPCLDGRVMCAPRGLSKHPRPKMEERDEGLPMMVIHRVLCHPLFKFLPTPPVAVVTSEESGRNLSCPSGKLSALLCFLVFAAGNADFKRQNVSAAFKYLRL